MKTKLLLLFFIFFSFNLEANTNENYKNLVKEQVRVLNKNLKINKNNEAYVYKVEYKNDKVIYYYKFNFKKYLSKADKIIPWEKDSEVTYPKLKKIYKESFSLLAIRNFTKTICFNNDSRYILKRGIPLSMKAYFTNGDYFTGVTVTEDTCKIYDKYKAGLIR